MPHFKGTVKWFNNAKDLSFSGRDEGAEVLLNQRATQQEGYKTLGGSDEVEFDPVQDDLEKRRKEADEALAKHRLKVRELEAELRDALLISNHRESALVMTRRTRLAVEEIFLHNAKRARQTLG